MDAIEIYRHPGKYPRLQVLQHAIARAVMAVDEIEALVLIRAAYASDDGAFASLDEARQIHESIMARVVEGGLGTAGDSPAPPYANALSYPEPRDSLRSQQDPHGEETFIILHLHDSPYDTRVGFLLLRDTPRVRMLARRWPDDHAADGETEADYVSFERFMEERGQKLPRYTTAWIGDL